MSMTESTFLRSLKMSSRCTFEPISKTKLLLERCWESAEKEAERMFTPWSPSTVVMSRTSLARSQASTQISTERTLGSSLSQATWISRPESLASSPTLVQSVRCTDTPRPRVMKPMISSPGEG
jgi:hypothetical protein